MINHKEAERCLNCKIPKCVEGCPINNRIPEFIFQIKNNNYEEAYKIIRDINPLGAICGRVCPYENQCQGNCIRGVKSEPIKIGSLEAGICDWARENNVKIKYSIKENGKKIAIIGSGPSGIACAVELRKLGYDVTIFEKENFLGGILMYGIPEYRLPKKIVTDVINDLLDLGIKVELNTILKADISEPEIKHQTKDNKEINKYLEKKIEEISLENKKNITIDYLLTQGYDAVYLGIGAEVSNILEIQGNNYPGIIGANEFLKHNINCKDKKVIVIGGGNVAMDSARVAKKIGADVTIVYRKQKENMPANKDEIEDAEKEKIKFIFGTNIINIKNIDDKNLLLECDTGNTITANYLIMAIGSTLNKEYIDKRLELTEQGLIKIGQNYETSINNIFAGGDIVQKKATVCMAIKNGKEAAKAINAKLNLKST